MAYDLDLADAIAASLVRFDTEFEERKMFGGLCFMVDDKMCLGIVKDTLMARVGSDFYEEALEKHNALPMDFTGRPMKGYIYVAKENLDQNSKIDFWVNKCLEFNPLAKASKKRKKKS